MLSSTKVLKDPSLGNLRRDLAQFNLLSDNHEMPQFTPYLTLGSENSIYPIQCWTNNEQEIKYKVFGLTRDRHPWNLPDSAAGVV
jgi:hypothetical protein